MLPPLGGLILGILTLAGVTWLWWRAPGRNQGLVEQQHVHQRHPFDP